MRCAAQPSFATVATRRKGVRPGRQAVHAVQAQASAKMLSKEASKVMEITAKTMHPFLEQNSDRLLVIDFYTTWCGPCKVMNPVVEKLADEFSGQSVQFAAFDCGSTDNDNQGFAVNLGVKALPTFHLYRGPTKVAELTGAKPEVLRRMIAQHARASA